MRKALWITVAAVFVVAWLLSGNVLIGLAVAAVVLVLWSLSLSMSELGRVQSFRIDRRTPEERDTERRPVAEDD
ncbi:MAG: hypothetical protein JWR33_1785 [Naasia sp.]|jgi:hypothetical protein|uniref:hypothetical protein n=1 Tax=Naasia sp. TaxID=2546198 RepID=UPI00262160AA|nr:hypothetical protein [Naasia sp.]MCU1571044.1 hypothetical protein [Naasia sp.]